MESSLHSAGMPALIEHNPETRPRQAEILDSQPPTEPISGLLELDSGRNVPIEGSMSEPAQKVDGPPLLETDSSPTEPHESTKITLNDFDLSTPTPAETKELSEPAITDSDTATTQEEPQRRPSFGERINSVRDAIGRGLEAPLIAAEKATNAVNDFTESLFNTERFCQRVEADPGVDNATQERTQEIATRFSNLQEAVEAQLQEKKYEGKWGKLQEALNNNQLVRESLGFGLTTLSLAGGLAGFADIHTLTKWGARALGAWNFGSISSKILYTQEMRQEIPAVLHRSRELLAKPKEEITEEEKRELQRELQGLLTKQIGYYKKGIELARYETQKEAPETGEPKSKVSQFVEWAKSPAGIKTLGIMGLSAAAPLAGMISPLAGAVAVSAVSGYSLINRGKRINQLIHEGNEQQKPPREMHETLKGLISKYQETNNFEEEQLGEKAAQLNTAATDYLKSQSRSGAIRRATPGVLAAGVMYAFVDWMHPQTAHADTSVEIHPHATPGAPPPPGEPPAGPPPDEPPGIPMTAADWAAAEHAPPESTMGASGGGYPSSPDHAYPSTPGYASGEHHTPDAAPHGERLSSGAFEPLKPEGKAEDPLGDFKHEAAHDVIEASKDHPFNHEYHLDGKDWVNIDLDHDGDVDAAEKFEVVSEGGKRYVLVDWADIRDEDGILDKLHDHVVKIEVPNDAKDIDITNRYGVIVSKSDHNKYFAGLDDKQHAVYTDKEHSLVYNFQNKLDVMRERIQARAADTGKDFATLWQEFKNQLGNRINRPDWQYTVGRSGAMASVDNDLILSPEIQVHRSGDDLVGNWHGLDMHFTSLEQPYSDRHLDSVTNGDAALARALEHSSLAYHNFSMQLDSITLPEARNEYEAMEELLNRLTYDTTELRHAIVTLPEDKKNELVMHLLEKIHEGKIYQEDLFQTLGLADGRAALAEDRFLRPDAPRIDKEHLNFRILELVGTFENSPWKPLLVNLQQNLKDKYSHISEILIARKPYGEENDVITLKLTGGGIKQFIVPPGKFNDIITTRT